MNKKTLIIIGISIGIIIIGIAMFFLFRPSETESPDEQGFFFALFPTSKDAENSHIPGQTDGALSSSAGPTTAQSETGLIQLTQVPVSGAVFHKESQKVRYFEKSTGHLYEVDVQNTNKKQITATTIPKTLEVHWSKDGSKAVLREPKRFFSAFSISNSVEGIFLPLNTAEVAVSPEEDKIFYILNNKTSQGVIASFENKEQKEIFTSPFSDFLTDWPQKNIITLLTKPSAFAKGYLYKINPQTKTFSKILGAINGLSALHSPFNSRIIYSQSENKTIATKIYNSSEKTSSLLGLKTLPEKCVFSKTKEDIIYCAFPKNLAKADYPDDWYKGLISFQDTIWQVNLLTGSTKIISDSGNFDAVNLFTDEQETYLFFQNKKDYTLWSISMDTVL